MENQFKDETIIRPILAGHANQEKIPSIHFLSGPAMGRLYALSNGEVTLGRNENSDIAINDEAISRFHCKFVVNENVVKLIDLKSANGTYVNGSQVKEHNLHAGDKIQISQASLIRFDYVDKLDADTFNRLYDLAVTDGLTGAHTKRYFLDQMKLEFAFAKRRELSLSLIMYDLDYFKKINDSHGHVVGDAALKRVAETTKLVIRKEDIFCRYGGEEFAILMRGTSKNDAIKMAERLRIIVEDTTYDCENIPINFNISLGVSTFEQNNYQSEEDFIKDVDRLLYLAKNQGRNRVVFAT